MSKNETNNNNLNSLFDEEDDVLEETTDDSQQVSFDDVEIKGKKGKKRKRYNADSAEENKNKIMGILLKHVLPIMGTFIIAVILTLVIASMFTGGSDEEVPSVTSIESKTNISDILYGYQSDQISAIRSQFNTLNTALTNTDDETQKIISSIHQQIQTDAKDTLDPFMSRLLTLSQFAEDRELELMRNDLMKHTTDAGANALYPLLSGRTPAKDMEADGKKSGSTMASLIGSDENNNHIYVVMTPYTANDKTVQAVYVVKINSGENKIDHITYSGILDTSKTNNTLYQSIDDALNGEAFTDNTSDDRVEQEQPEQENADEQPEQENVEENAEEQPEQENEEENADENADENAE